MATKLYPYQGGLGTSTVPVTGQVPIGQADGTYEPGDVNSITSLDRLTSAIGSLSTLVLTDDGSNQTLTGNLGNLNIQVQQLINIVGLYSSDNIKLKTGKKIILDAT